MPARMKSGVVLLVFLLGLGFVAAVGADLREAVKQGPLIRQVKTAEPEFKDGGALIIPCELVVVGQLVDEHARLADDASLVQTDYTIEVSEVWIDPGRRVAPGQQIVVSHPGGQARVDGVPVAFETPDFDRLEWLVPYVFFLDVTPGGYRFRGGAQGVWELREGRAWSHLTRRYDLPVRRQYNGDDAGYFSRRVHNIGPPGTVPAAEPRDGSPATEHAREAIQPTYPQIPGLGERWVVSDLVVRGRVVDQTARLSDDGRSVWTDYSVEVLEVFKPPKGGPAAGSTLTVRAEGGNLALPGRVLSLVNELFPPLPWVREHVFFLTRGSDQAGPYRFLDGARSVFRRDDESKLRCHLPKAEWDFLCRSRDGRSWEELLRDLKKQR